MSSCLGALENESHLCHKNPKIQAAGSSHYLRITMMISTSSPSIIAFIIKNFFMKFSLTTWEHIDFSFFLSQQLECLILVVKTMLDLI